MKSRVVARHAGAEEGVVNNGCSLSLSLSGDPLDLATTDTDWKNAPEEHERKKQKERTNEG